MKFETTKETLEFLVSHSDPEGPTITKLKKLLDQVNRNVFLGPKSRRYINGLVEKLDNIECASLSGDGKCKKIPGKTACNHKDRYSLCEWYSVEKDGIRGNPLDGLNKIGG